MNHKVFVIMPFEDEFFEMYELLKHKFGDRFILSNASEEDNQQNILKDIVYPLYECDVVLADLTGQNSNVMYELGVAHALGKKTIIITKDDLGLLPFDLKMYRVKKYDVTYKQFDELIDYLDKNLNGAINNTVIFGNPILDVLRDKGVADICLNNTDKDLIADIDDKGFIDYLAEIEMHVTEFNGIVNNIASDMQIMSNGIANCTNGINRVNGDGSASFVRKQSKKIAGYIDEFESKLKSHNEILSTTWDEIEVNTIGLIENPVVTNKENKDGLLEYLKSLESIKGEAVKSAESFEDIKKQLNGLVGLQSNITHAVKFLIEDLNTFMTFVYSMSSSIDKIMNRARNIVGSIG